MMTTVICTECGDPVVITSRNVVLPFVCNKHNLVPEEKIVAKKSNMSRTAAQQPVEADISNEMMLDMAAQLQKANEDLAAALDSKEYLNKMFNTMSDTLADVRQQLDQKESVLVSDTAVINNLSKKIETLDQEKLKLAEALVRAINKIVQLAKDVEIRNIAGEQVCKELQVSEQARRGLQSSCEGYRKDISYFRDRMYRYESDYIKIKHELALLKGRGFWARVWQKD